MTNDEKLDEILMLVHTIDKKQAVLISEFKHLQTKTDRNRCRIDSLQREGIPLTFKDWCVVIGITLTSVSFLFAVVLVVMKSRGISV